MITIEQAYKLREALLQASKFLDDEIATEVPQLFPKWSGASVTYAVGDRVNYYDTLYKCIQAHTSQADWDPENAVSLWAHTSVEEWPAWIQPTGAQDAYNKGDKVIYNGTKYVSDVDANVWAPGVYGWSVYEE